MRRWRLSEFSMGYFEYVRCFGIFAPVLYCPRVERYYYNLVEKTMADGGVFFFGKIIASAAVSANTIVYCSTVIVG